jgi:hypothetical protein
MDSGDELLSKSRETAPEQWLGAFGSPPTGCAWRAHDVPWACAARATVTTVTSRMESAVDVGSPAAAATGRGTSTECGRSSVKGPGERTTPLVAMAGGGSAVPQAALSEGLVAGLGRSDVAGRLRWRASRGLAALARVAAVDLVSGEAPLDLAVLRAPALDGPEPVSRPGGMRGPVAPPPVDRSALPPGRDVAPTLPDQPPGSPASRLIEALTRFERRVLGLVVDASPGLREPVWAAEARRLMLIHFHRLLVRELVGGLADPEVVAAALADGLPFHDAMATRAGHKGPVVATECLVVLDTLATVLGADDPETPKLPLGAVLLAGASMGVPTSTVTARVSRFARLLQETVRRALPSGQALATAFGFDALPAAAIASRWPAAVRSGADAGALARATPLPLYVLAEAEIDGDGRLGPVGSRILAEGLLGSIRSRFPERALDPRGRLESAGLRERDGRAVIGLVDVLRFIGAAGLAD